MDKVKRSKLMEIFDDEPDEVIATFATMKRIYKEYGELPRDFLAEDGVTLDYDRIAKIYWFLVQQDDPSVTEEAIMDKLTQHNVHKAVPLLTTALTLYIPEELLLEAIESEKDKPTVEKDVTAKDDKGGKAKNAPKAKSST